MPRVEPPAIHPMGKNRQISDIERFAKAYFNIELTSQQMEYIAIIAGTGELTLKREQKKKNVEKELAIKVVIAYLQEGIKLNGRARLPQYELPAHIGKTKLKNKTQHGRVLEMIKRPGGAFNFELSRISLRYGGTIFELRKDGHNIVADRQYLKNGKASNTWRYRLGGH